MFRAAARQQSRLAQRSLARRTFASTSSIRSTPTLNSLDTFSDEENMLREAVARFATDVVGPKVREMDENEQMDPLIIQGLFEQGLMGIETSAEHSGAESSFTSAIIAIEELAKVDPSVSVLCDVHNTLVNTILRKYATKEQQAKWLPQLSESKGSFCLSEPASGSDAFALQTRAKQDGDSWIINGSKIKGYKGITCFLATKDMGIKIAKKEQKLGIRASSTCTLNFDDLKIPSGERHRRDRKGLQGAFNKAVPYTYERKQQAIDIEAAKLLTYNAARRKEQGLDFTKEAAMAKYWSSVIAQKVSGSAIEWAGGVGFTRETGIEKFWRDSKIGTSNIQLNTIARFVREAVLMRHFGHKEASS
ncbi:acyl-CoA oxidase [Flagelloscypha sp. PMI_526]|nr:acyl-CoA oxidase [Flagelloscypha sp. PMI_526]